jgi:hypothetical protein
MGVNDVCELDVVTARVDANLGSIWLDMMVSVVESFGYDRWTLRLYVGEQMRLEWMGVAVVIVECRSMIVDEQATEVEWIDGCWIACASVEYLEHRA